MNREELIALNELAIDLGRIYISMISMVSDMCHKQDIGVREEHPIDRTLPPGIKIKDGNAS